MWTFIRRSQKCYQYDLSIPIMEGIVFVYIFRTISFAGHLNEYLQFACLLQLIRCFLFANVNEFLHYSEVNTSTHCGTAELKCLENREVCRWGGAAIKSEAYNLWPWSSWTANSDKKYMELNGAALNVNNPWVIFQKTA